MKRRTTPLVVILLALLPASLPLAAPQTGFGRVTFAEGEARFALRPTGPFLPLEEGRLVRPGQILKTGADGRLEITFLDGSVVRLSRDSDYQAKSAVFDGNSRRQFSATLSSGRAWARVRPATVRRRDSFQIATPSAVISVRGTTYDLVAGADESTEVSVYDGRVGVAPPPIEEGAAHEEISWPEEVTEAAWEEIILGKLQRLHIGADGRPGAPASFSPEAELDDWVQWNLERDRESRP